MKNQMATVGSISKTNRQRLRITCPARPKPIALSAHSRRTLYPHHSGGSTPKSMTPRRDFTPAPVSTLCDHLVLTERTASQSDRCSCFRTLLRLPAKYSARLDRLSLEIAPALSRLLPPATSDLGYVVQYELPASARLNIRGPYRTATQQFRLSNDDPRVRDHNGQGPTLR